MMNEKRALFVYLHPSGDEAADNARAAYFKRRGAIDGRYVFTSVGMYAAAALAGHEQNAVFLEMCRKAITDSDELWLYTDGPTEETESLKRFAVELGIKAIYNSIPAGELDVPEDEKYGFYIHVANTDMDWDGLLYSGKVLEYATKGEADNFAAQLLAKRMNFDSMSEITVLRLSKAEVCRYSLVAIMELEEYECDPSDDALLYTVKGKEYINTGGNCMVAVLHVHLDEHGKDIWLNTNDEYTVVTTRDYISTGEVPTEDEIAAITVRIFDYTDGAETAGAWHPMLDEAMSYFIEQVCKESGDVSWRPDWLPVQIRTRLDPDDFSWMAYSCDYVHVWPEIILLTEEWSDVRYGIKDGENIWVKDNNGFIEEFETMEDAEKFAADCLSAGMYKILIRPVAFPLRPKPVVETPIYIDYTRAAEHIRGGHCDQDADCGCRFSLTHYAGVNITLECETCQAVLYDVCCEGDDNIDHIDAQAYDTLLPFTEELASPGSIRVRRKKAGMLGACLEFYHPRTDQVLFYTFTPTYCGIHGKPEHIKVNISTLFLPNKELRQKYLVKTYEKYTDDQWHLVEETHGDTYHLLMDGKLYSWHDGTLIALNMDKDSPTCGRYFAYEIQAEDSKAETKLNDKNENGEFQ